MEHIKIEPATIKAIESVLAKGGQAISQALKMTYSIGCKQMADAAYDLFNGEKEKTDRLFCGEQYDMEDR